MRPLIAFLVFAGTAAAGDSLPSGPRVGDKLPDFKSKAFSGPDAGKEFKLLDRTKKGPTLVIFVHEITRPGLQFLRPVDDFVADKDKLATQVVWLTEDVEKTEAFLDRAKNSLSLKAPISIGKTGKEGLEAYGLNDQVKITVLIANENKVVANFALVSPNGKDARPVIEAIKKLVK